MQADNKSNTPSNVVISGTWLYSTSVEWCQTDGPEQKINITCRLKVFFYKTYLIQKNNPPQKGARGMMSDVRDKYTDHKAVDQRLECILHERHCIEMATIADSIFGAKDEVTNTRAHEAGNCK